MTDVVEDSQKSQTPDDVSARRREWIGLCAAKSYGMEGEIALRYARRIRRTLILPPRSQAIGTARPFKTGIKIEILRRAGPFLLVPIVCVAAALSEPDLWLAAIFISVLALLFGLPLGTMTVWNWREQIMAAGLAMLPAAKAAIRVDEKSLTVGAISVPWADVGLEGIELDYLWRPRINPKHRVGQLRLATSKGHLLLDRRLIENGQEVVDAICGNLVEVN